MILICMLALVDFTAATGRPVQEAVNYGSYQEMKWSSIVDELQWLSARTQERSRKAQRGKNIAEASRVVLPPR